jgi:4-hydroxy-tetrahydrodipicolinate synthase
MVTSFLEGDVKKACKMQIDCIPLCNALFCEVNPIPAKAALNMMGKEVGGLRAPLTVMEPQNQETLRKAMKDMKLL